jgi:hypothetical protein
MVMRGAELSNTPEAYDLVIQLFPGTPEADRAQAEATRLREALARRMAEPELEGRDLVQQIQTQLLRLGCSSAEPSGTFDSVTIQGLRASSLHSDDRFYWHRPTMAALRALRKLHAGCAIRQTAAVQKCLRINNEDFCY